MDGTNIVTSTRTCTNTASEHELNVMYLRDHAYTIISYEMEVRDKEKIDERERFLELLVHACNGLI